MELTDVTYRGNSFSIVSRLSFASLINSWKEKIRENKPGISEFYSEMLNRVTQFPELLEPIDDLATLEKHHGLIATMMTTIFPITVSDKKDLIGVSIPFTYKTIYSSSLFKAVFMNQGDNMIVIPDEETERKISEEKLITAYLMVLNKFYGLDLNANAASVYPVIDKITGLNKYLEVEVDASFVDVKLKGELPALEKPPSCMHLTDLLKIPDLHKLLPLDGFQFEGISIIRIKNVTEREAISEIKNSLLTVHSFADSEAFEGLQHQMQKLIGARDVKIGIAPFFKVNDHYVFAEHLSRNSFLLKEFRTTEEKIRLCKQFIDEFDGHNEYFVIPYITSETITRYPFLQRIADEGVKSLIICPLRSGKELIGVLSLLSDTPGLLGYPFIPKIEPAIPLFVLALEKSAQDLYNLIDKVIKEKFTAVQSSVEWKFTEAALHYLTQKYKGEESRIESIAFENVFPLYGAIDVRNSSIERSQAIQQDLLEQLQLASTIIKKAQLQLNFPLLEEINHRIEKHIYTVSNILFSGDEITINNFLKEEIVKLLNHLKIIIPGIRQDIVSYFSAIDDSIHMRYEHRKAFEKSITIINDELGKLIDKEQDSAQEVFPHYFERFATDGVDFNIYIGQSITPNKPFNIFYLNNLKLWQLTTLIKAAQMTNELEGKLPLPLKTTQLILAHSNPISISFRTAERKFDVDGAYNIRYEIIKKRIDKVRIKDSNERLTQPGKIAIVYTQPREAIEYSEYIDYLEKQGLLTGEVEKYDLEELQGVSGLKAIRVTINLENQIEENGTNQESKVGRRES